MTGDSKPGKAIIGIAGGAGAGKSTVAAQLAVELDAVHIELDSFYKDLRSFDVDDQSEVNYDHPKTVDWPELYRVLDNLSNGSGAEVPIYDFDTAERVGTRTIESAEYIIVEGIHALLRNATTARLDHMVYIELEADKRLVRRLRRDIHERGDTLDDVLERHENYVQPMHETFIEPTKAKANLVYRGDADIEETVADCMSHVLGSE